MTGARAGISACAAFIVLAFVGACGRTEAPSERSDPPARERGLGQTPVAHGLVLSWRAPIDSRTPQPGVVLFEDSIRVNAGSSSFTYDKTGKPVHRFVEDSYYLVSSPVADRDGNLYFASFYATSLDRRGRLRWRVPLRDAARATEPNPFVLSDDGIVYSAQNDGLLKALDASNGDLLWQRELAPRPTNAATYLLGGAGDELFVVVAGTSLEVFDRRTGGLRRSVAPDTADGESRHVPVAIMSGGGALTIARARDEPARVEISRVGADGSLLWASAQDRFRFPLAVDASQRVLLLEREPGGPSSSSLLVAHEPCRGEPASPPIRLGTLPPPSAAILAADGTLYLIHSLRTGNERELILVAVDPRSGVHRISFPGLMLNGIEWRGTPALADDGVLYFVAESITGAGELVAVQTESHGLAETSLPSRRHDNRQTGWARAMQDSVVFCP